LQSEIHGKGKADKKENIGKEKANSVRRGALFLIEKEKNKKKRKKKENTR